MTGERFDYVWDAIASDPAEAADLRHRADLMIRLNALTELYGRRSDVVTPFLIMIGLLTL